MISHRFRCIFVHIPKTAGTSIEQCLAHDGEFGAVKQDHRSIVTLSKAIWPNELSSLLSADTLRYFYQNYARWRSGFPRHTRAQFESYYKFSFVRNPWSRAFSWYRNVMRDAEHRREHGIEEDLSLSEFLTRHADSWALQPQLSWITDKKGDIAVDFVGKFENLQQDFDIVCERLSIRGPQLDHLISSNNPSYLESYDDKSRRIVASRYAEEIEYFGYRFGD